MNALNLVLAYKFKRPSYTCNKRLNNRTPFASTRDTSSLGYDVIPYTVNYTHGPIVICVMYGLYLPISLSLVQLTFPKVPFPRRPKRGSERPETRDPAQLVESGPRLINTYRFEQHQLHLPFPTYIIYPPATNEGQDKYGKGRFRSGRTGSRLRNDALPRYPFMNVSPTYFSLSVQFSTILRTPVSDT